MIDTHSHIYSEEFDTDRDETIQRAKKAGVTHIILPNVDSETLPQMLALEAEYPDFCYAAIGLHPTSVKENYREELALIKTELASIYIGTKHFWLNKSLLFSSKSTGYWNTTYL